MRVIAVGASAGGIRALRVLLGGLPAGLDAAVLVVIHLAPSSPGFLPQILGGAGPLACRHPEQGEKLERAHVYIAPPDRHMLVDARGSIRLSRGPKENRMRPAVDPLFRSVALAYGPAVVGVILTGNLDDGTAGLLAVRQCGGTTVIQDPADAEAPSMPLSATQHVDIDYQVPLPEMAPLLVRLVGEQPTAGRRRMPNQLEIETQIAAHNGAAVGDVAQLGEPSVFTCPDCHGTLMRVRDEHLLRFRCHTGHAFTAQSLLASLDESTEDAIWNAVRALDEGGMLLKHLARHARDAGQPEQALALDQQAKLKLRQAELIRRSIAGQAREAEASAAS